MATSTRAARSEGSKKTLETRPTRLPRGPRSSQPAKVSTALLPASTPRDAPKAPPQASVPGDTSQHPVLAFPGAACHKGSVERLRDFDSINAHFSVREIDEMQAAIDARREARATQARPTGGAGCNSPGPTARPTPRRQPDRARGGLVSKGSGTDKAEGAIDKVTGRAKEATGSLTGNKDRKAEGRADQDKGTLKKKKGAVKDLLK
jgi:uncharacterized protein YjbJ (UPF0337 family)